VRLTVTGPGGSDTIVQPVIVNAGPAASLVISPAIATVAAEKTTFLVWPLRTNSGILSQE
jgi:hypothetical protein